ncbi:HlyD family secretion protein [Spirosomataceae bacterium TFI 002]|nr:HlyD family secretion protein [Spirosomataceae bacterium TFI 002]
MKNKYLLIFASLVVMMGCNNGENQFDATGVFESTEVIISSETSGKILSLTLEEGDELSEGQPIGNIDCENLTLQKAQAEASLEAISAKTNSPAPQVEILKQQLNSQQKQLSAQRAQLGVMEKEQKRVQNLVKAEAIPTKQLDDVNGQVEVLQKQIEAAESQLGVTRQQIKSQEQQIGIANRAVLSERKPMQERIAQVANMMENCSLVNPIKGTVLVKYAETNEITGPGKALYKVADLSEMVLRAYISGNQLAQVKTGDKVKVMVDNGTDGYKELVGEISTISAKAEFTPKTIQTKDERANLVYAAKIKVKNDGYLKIGMYGEVVFNK